MSRTIHWVSTTGRFKTRKLGGSRRKPRVRSDPFSTLETFMDYQRRRVKAYLDAFSYEDLTRREVRYATELEVRR